MKAQVSRESGSGDQMDCNLPVGEQGLAARISGTITRRWDVLVILALAVLLWLPRLSGPIDLRYDAGVYYLLGTSLATGHGYRIPSEPGSPEALQYPPLLPAIVATYERALRTTDYTVVGPWLRTSYALLFLTYGLAVLALARRYLRPKLALVAALLCLLHYQSIFLSDLLFAELPFAVLAVGFALVAGSAREPLRPWLREMTAFAFAAAGFLLRTAGVALLAAWVLEALSRKRWRLAIARGALALVPIMAWQAYVARVRTSDEYRHPAYEYQRASYQYYNVSYAENALLIDPFQPELGRVGPGALATRLTTNLPELVAAVGEAVSTSATQWRQLLGKTQHKLLGRPLIPLNAVFVGILMLSAFIIVGLVLLAWRRAWLMAFILLGSIALVWTTPWPAQFSRYLAPLTAFVDICLVLAWSQISGAVRARVLGRAGILLRAALVGVLALAFTMETYTALRLFHARQLPDGIVFDPKRHGGYRLFAHEESWRAWEKAVAWISINAPQDGIIATTAPHFCYLLTGRRAVLPPMESDPLRARRLLDAVPVSNVIIDKLEFLDVSRRYARPAVETNLSEWRLVYSVDGTQTYARTIGPQGH